MTRTKRAFLFPAALAITLALGGCRTTSPPAANAPAVYCPKCEVVWVERYDTVLEDDAYVKSGSCPDCVSAVRSFFATGELQHRCATCEATLQNCSVHPVPPQPE